MVTIAEVRAGWAVSLLPVEFDTLLASELTAAIAVGSGRPGLPWF